MGARMSLVWVAISMIACSSSDFSGQSESKTQKKSQNATATSPTTSDPTGGDPTIDGGNPGNSTTGNGSPGGLPANGDPNGATTIGGSTSSSTNNAGTPGGSGDEGGGIGLENGAISVTPIVFKGPENTLMFRGSRGANLKLMTVGIYKNATDQSLLQASKGSFVVSGLRTGAFNDWGLFVRSLSPVVTSDQITTRQVACSSDEIVVGLPDVGVDAQPGQRDENAVKSWNNRYLCAKVLPQYTLSDPVSVPYSHTYNISVDCPDSTVMTGYNCGACGAEPPSPATLSCAKLKAVP